jgi:hypothetical protein
MSVFPKQDRSPRRLMTSATDEARSPLDLLAAGEVAIPGRPGI